MDADNKNDNNNNLIKESQIAYLTDNSISDNELVIDNSICDFNNHDKEDNQNFKQIMADILVTISWREVARTYFQKSASWIYHKMDGIDGNGKKGGFSETEALQLKGAL